ncbi:MAG: GvpL/GvpF family gas vesicle protein [Actinobacteria bacterium]|nr:GvpL/GvpF family gas vesicle protein [Actinomycetota bacterium]
MEKTGKYIYGIMNSNSELQIKDFDLGVYAISYQDISAVVSDSDIVDYTCMPKDALARLLVEHQKVVERIMGLEYTIIPVRLGTFVMDEAEVRGILSKGYGLIKEIFQKIDHRIEIDLVCTWSDFTSAIKEAGEEKEIKEWKEKLLANPERVTVDDQMKIGVMLEKALDEIRKRYVFRIQDTLKVISDDNKQHELMDDKMVLNSAFLIDKVRQKEFYTKIEDLNDEFAEKLNFRCVGPLPTYSFYTLEVKNMQFNEVDWARKRLGILNDSINKDDIKKAYRAQARTWHPDKNLDKSEMEKEFDEIRKSYNILLDFAQACEQANQESLIFNEDEFKKNAVLIKVRD